MHFKAPLAPEKSDPKRILFASFWWAEDLMCRVAHHAVRHGWHLDLQMCLTNEIPRTWSGDGIITARSGDNESIHTLLAGSGCPVVSLNINSHPHGIPCVVFDLRESSRLAVEHFLQRGFREFAFYSRRLKVLYNSQIAHAAFRQKVETAHGTLHDLDWKEEQGDATDTWENRQEWLQRKLRDVPKPVAIFSAESECAVEIIEACYHERLQVPDQVSVLHMGGSNFFSECSIVPLSFVDVDNDAKARMACELLEAMMNGAPAPEEPILVPPKGICARASTDTLAASNPAVTRAIRFMLDHYADSIGIDDAVQVSGMSRTLLFRAFKADLGQTPHAALMRIRLDKAKTMLQETDAKLSQVAQACGFGHPVGLHHHFKKVLNMSPGAYREFARQE